MIATMRLYLLGSAIVLVGCDEAFGLERAEPECAETFLPVLEQGFDQDVEACDPWAERFDAAGTTVIQRAGELQVTPRGPGAAGCVSRSAFRFPRGGLIVEVVGVVAEDGAYTSINVGDDDSIQMKNGELVYEKGNGSQRYNTVPFDRETMRWWKLSDEQGVLTASYSPDGLAEWTVFGMRPSPGPGNVRVAVLAGLFLEMPNATGAARYGRLLVCD